MKVLIKGMVLSLLAAMPYCAMGASPFHVTDLGDLPGGAVSARGWGINAYGQVVGESEAATGTRAFLWTPATPNGIVGAMIDLGELPGGLANNPPADFSEGFAINNFGQVTGTSHDAVGTGTHAFLWTPVTANGVTGSMVSLGGIPASFTDISQGTGINSVGQVTGYSYVSTGDCGFLWNPNTLRGPTGVMSSLGVPSDATGSHADGINDYGQAVGWSDGGNAFLWTPNTAHGNTGSMVNLSSLPGQTGGNTAHAINATGRVVGWSGAYASSRAFIWTPITANSSTGSMIDLGDLPGSDPVRSSAWAINAIGQVVGDAVTSTGSHVFIWTSETGMSDLGGLLDASGTGWTLFQVYGINDVGQITGVGSIDGSNELHAFLLTPSPVPEPQSAATWALALMLALSRRGSRRKAMHVLWKVSIVM